MKRFLIREWKERENALLKEISFIKIRLFSNILILV